MFTWKVMSLYLTRQLMPGGSGKDRIWNGADDNASGTTGVIELAEHFALSPERTRRSVVFIAFAAEELGLIGSRHYVAHPAVPLERTVAMLTLDMIGRSDGKRLFIGGIGTSPAFDAILTEAATARRSLRLRSPPRAALRAAANRPPGSCRRRPRSVCPSGDRVRLD